MKIAVSCTIQSLQMTAKNLAARLNLPFVSLSDLERNMPEILLRYTPEHLELLQTDKDSPGPVFIDFVHGQLAHRIKYGGGSSQLVAKAVGLKTHKNLHVLDITAGLGRDSFVLANLGCHVTLLERSPIIASLLEDAMSRAQEMAISAVELMRVINTDAKEYLSTLIDLPDVIYMDPMYPPTKKTALVKKEMRLLRALIGDDLDADELLNLSLGNAKKRIVVKRSYSAPFLANQKPDFSYKGQSSRFDIYLTN